MRLLIRPEDIDATTVKAEFASVHGLMLNFGTVAERIRFAEKLMESEQPREFVYFESTEGGMYYFKFTEAENLSGLRAWGEYPEDAALVDWMRTAEPGAMFEHRLGVAMRRQR